MTVSRKVKEGLQTQLTKVTILGDGLADYRKGDKDKQALSQADSDALRNENAGLGALSLQKDEQHQAGQQSPADTIAELQVELQKELATDRAAQDGTTSHS